MLGATELFNHGERDVGCDGSGQIITGDLAATVRSGLRIDLAPVELKIGDQRLFLHFADGGRERLFAGLNHTLGKIPMVERAQQQKPPAFRCFSNHHHAGG